MTRYTKVLLVRKIELLFPFVRKIRPKAVKIFFVMLFSPFAVPILLKSRKKAVIPYLELVITEKCTLKCVNCANLVQCYEAPKTYPLNEITVQLDTLGGIVSEVLVMQILGGEPFMNKDSGRILEYIAGKPFIKNAQVVTNGTLMPGRDALDALKNKKFTVHISDYGGLSDKKDELIKTIKQGKIKFLPLKYGGWTDYGDFEKNSLTPNELERSYRECSSAECKTLIKGKIFTCPRSAHLYNLGVLPSDGEYLELNSLLTADKIKKFYNRKTVSACAHCNPPWARAQVEPARQEGKI